MPKVGQSVVDEVFPELGPKTLKPEVPLPL